MFFKLRGILFFAFLSFKSKMMILLSFFCFLIEKPKKAQKNKKKQKKTKNSKKNKKKQCFSKYGASFSLLLLGFKSKMIILLSFFLFFDRKTKKNLEKQKKTKKNQKNLRKTKKTNVFQTMRVHF